MKKTGDKLLDFIIISGPTAVGKTSFVENMVKNLDAEIISADSQAVYKYMDIGTDKPESNKKIKYHLIDKIEPDNNYTVADFVDDVDAKIKKIQSRGKKVIICGGTPMYINKLIYGLTDAPGKDKELRKELRQKAENKGRKHLHDKLKKIDPISAEKIHPNDLYRTVRALEIYYLTGKTRTQWHKKTPKPRYNYIYFLLTRNREKLYEKINKRVENMIEKGLIEEVKNLLKKGYTGDDYGFQAIGYKEVIKYLKNKIDKEEMVRLIKRNTRHLAKRQLIWFRKEDNLVQYDIGKEDFRSVINDMKEKIKQKGELK